MIDWDEKRDFHSLKFVILLFALLCIFLFSLIILSLPVEAAESVSDDSAFIQWEKDNVDAIRNGLAEKGLVITNDYYDDDYYYVDPDDNLWRDILRQWGIDGTDYGKPLSRVAYDYAVQNNISNTQIYNDCFDSVYNYVNSNVPYYIYHSMPVSDFFTYFIFNPLVPASSMQNFRNWIVPIVNNQVDTLCGFYCYSFLNDGTNYLTDYSGMLTDYSFALYSGGFYGYQDLPYQSYEFTYVSDTTYPLASDKYIKFFSNDIGSLYDGNFTYWQPSSGSVSLNGADSHSCVGFYVNRFYPVREHNCNGTLYLSPDSVGSYSFPVFKSSADVQLFFKGRSTVYSFDPSIDINSYGSDLDLTDLYDVIRDTVSDSEGDIIASINQVANNYLKDQVELLGDIKNALNDSFGRSWLRIISGQLDDYFPRTLIKLEELKEAFLSFSPGGSSGSADLTQLEDDVAFIKGLLILQTAHDIIDDLENDNVNDSDFTDVVTVANTKFPFSIPNDIVSILSLFVAEPREPEFLFPVPFSDNHETFEIDISYIDSSLPYIRGAFIILFIIFLVFISVKIINSLKE